MEENMPMPNLQDYRNNFTNSPSYYQEQKSELIKWQLDPQDIISEIELNLKGLAYEEVMIEGNAEPVMRLVKKYAPLMNQDGVNGILSTSRSFFTKLFILSNFKTEEINRMTIIYGHALIDLLSLKYKKYEIDEAQLSMIVIMLVNIFYSSLMRAKDGGERDFLKMTEKHVETFVERPPELQHKGFFSRFKV